MGFNFVLLKYKHLSVSKPIDLSPISKRFPSTVLLSCRLVASGKGTWSVLLWPRPRELLRLGVNGGGQLADPDAAAAAHVGVASSCAAELNSTQHGHLWFFSASRQKEIKGRK